MKSLSESFKKIFGEDRGFLGLVFLLFLVGISLFIYTLIRINTGKTLVYVGYGDIGGFTGGEIASLWSSGGYRAGGTGEMVAFPILMMIFGVFHSLIAVQIYERKGKGIARMFILLTFLLMIGAVVTLTRLLGEG